VRIENINDLQEGYIMADSGNAVFTKDFAKKLKDWGVVSNVKNGLKLTRVFQAAIMDELQKGNEVRFRGFGAFRPRLRKGGTRKMLGVERVVGDRNIVTFKSSVALKNFLNDPDAVNPALALVDLAVDDEE